MKLTYSEPVYFQVIWMDFDCYPQINNQRKSTFDGQRDAIYEFGRIE